MLEIQNVTKCFENKPAVETISLCAEKGEIVGVIGANGAGKSTLLRMIAGVLVPDSGTIAYDGAGLINNVALRRQIFFFPDEPFFHQNATIRDAAKLYAIFYNSFDFEVFYKLCETFELNPKTKITKLSKGMKRQVMLLIGVSIRPAYMILDEAFDGIDSVAKQNMRSMLERLSAQYETTVIIASHNIREIEDLCGRIVLMYRSKLVLDKRMEQLHAEAEAMGENTALEAILMSELEVRGYGSKNIDFL